VRNVYTLKKLLCAALGAIVVASFAQAQEGHPLKGSWIGQWDGNDAHGNSVLVVLDWDGREITGIINPGTHNIRISNATLNPDDWTVRIEASGEVAGGSTVTYRIEGRIEDLAMAHRNIVGTWRSERGSGAFEIQRQ
jgi:hypothetical protein